MLLSDPASGATHLCAPRLLGKPHIHTTNQHQQKVRSGISLCRGQPYRYSTFGILAISPSHHVSFVLRTLFWKCCRSEFTAHVIRPCNILLLQFLSNTSRSSTHWICPFLFSLLNMRKTVLALYFSTIEEDMTATQRGRRNRYLGNSKTFYNHCLTVPSSFPSFTLDIEQPYTHQPTQGPNMKGPFAALQT